MIDTALSLPPLVQRAIDAHGGLDRWNAVTMLGVRFSIGGYLYTLKGHPDGLHDATMYADAKIPRVAVSPFRTAATSAHFTPERVWIQDGDGNVRAERDSPRGSFAGHALSTPWDDLQFLYFTSYALWNYLTTPFLFARPGFIFRDLEPVVENGETWNRLAVVFPPDVPTHCAEQIFYFNEKGLLMRVDYVTEVAGGVAAHYCYDHTAFGGIVFPTLRRVVPRVPEPKLNGRSAVLLQLHDVTLL